MKIILGFGALDSFTFGVFTANGSDEDGEFTLLTIGFKLQILIFTFTNKGNKMRKVLNLSQGSEEWKQARLKHFCASEAPAVMGVSKYMTRTELLDLKSRVFLSLFHLINKLFLIQVTKPKQKRGSFQKLPLQQNTHLLSFKIMNMEYLYQPLLMGTIKKGILFGNINYGIKLYLLTY